MRRRKERNDKPVAENLSQPFDDLGRFRPRLSVLTCDSSDPDDWESSSPDDNEGHEEDQRKLVLNWVLRNERKGHRRRA